MKKYIVSTVALAIFVILFTACGNNNAGVRLAPMPNDTTKTIIVYWEHSQTDSAKIPTDAYRLTKDTINLSIEPLQRIRDTQYFVPRFVPVIDSAGVKVKDSLVYAFVDKKKVVWDGGVNLDSLLKK